MRSETWLRIWACANLILSAFVSAQPLLVPNGSFESPATVFVDNRVDGWQKSPKPFWFVEGGGFTWDQLSGVFKNTDSSKSDHIVNCDGAQGFYLFAVPEVGIFQDSVGAGARFSPGKSYAFTAGVVGGGGGMISGVSMEMSLYFRDASGNRVVVAATNIIHDSSRFPNQTNFVDIQLRVPVVKAGDSWAGKWMGLQFVSTVDPAKAGGYWDLDNVRLSESIEIPNASFESPVTAFVDNRVDFWQKTPKPFWYDESGGFKWDQLSGVFKNTDVGKEDHIDNLTGSQGVYLFAVPTVGLFLDDRSTNSVPESTSSPFAARFEPGKSYVLSGAVLGGGGGMTNGVTLEWSFYYRDEAGNPVTISRSTFTNDSVLFPSKNHFVDFQLRSLPVKPTDPWSGKSMGIQILSTVDPSRAGGYWDIDNVRLSAVPEPVLLNPSIVGGQFEFTLQSEPGSRYDVLKSSGIVLPAVAWTKVLTITNATGFFTLRVTNATSSPAYFQLRQLP